MKIIEKELNHLPSDKKFGLFFAFIFFIFSFYYFFAENYLGLIVFFFLSALFLMLAICYAEKLHYLNKLWFKLGLFLGKIVSPIILGLIYFLLITPVSIVTSLFGRDELKIRKKSKKSFWINRSQESDYHKSFKNQF